MTIVIPQPSDFGAPAKFSAWRPEQHRLFNDMRTEPNRFFIGCAPTGSGKSPAYIIAALADPTKRVAVLTESKGLQDQLVSDFGAVGLFDIRGLQNYTCKALEPGGEHDWLWVKQWGRPTCHLGPCQAGVPCELKDEGCLYFDDLRRARSARLVSTNYAYWIAVHRYGQGLGSFDWLILDEAHSAHDQLVSALTVKFTEKDFKELNSTPPKFGSSIQRWRMWSREMGKKATGKLGGFSFLTRPEMYGRTQDAPNAEEVKFWKELEGKCNLVSLAQNNWVVKDDKKEGYTTISPPWVKAFTEELLFRDIPRVTMVSATIVPKAADLLGIPEQFYTYKEYASSFPSERRPIHWLRTGVDLSYDSLKTHPNRMRTLVAKIDAIIRKRLDRNGIIHTISFDLQRYLMEHSQYRSMFIANKSGGTLDAVNEFRSSKKPCILLSPSVGTGYDFPMDAARYQIILKVPFPVTNDSVIVEQSRTDPDYVSYLTSQSLIQMYGRTNRAEDDFSETFIVDDRIQRFVEKYSHYVYMPSRKRFVKRETEDDRLILFTAHFMEAIRVSETAVPDPPTLRSIAA